MIDFHSHVLPRMDDGSKSVEMSLQMLKLNYSHGVDVMCATPHFYAQNESPDSFLERRSKSFDLMCKAMDNDTPKIILGAEVMFYPGMSNSEDLCKLTLGDTNLLMVEMPFYRWTRSTINEVKLLENNLGVRVVLAHIERYRHIQDKKLFAELLDDNLMLQCNAEAFLSFSTRRFVLNMLRQGYIKFIGTDCHNITTRKPNMSDALEVIKKKAKDVDINQFNATARSLISYE